MFVVYLITNMVNGKRYVGKTKSIKKRWYDHCARAASGSGSAIHAAIRKYGRDAFVIKEIERCADERTALDAEQMHIAVLRTNLEGYNLTEGGEGCSGYRHTPESLKKMGDVHRGQVWTEEQRARMSDALRGRVFEPEWRRKISEAKKGHEVSAETRAKLSAKMRGRKHTPEAMEKIREANRDGHHRLPHSTEAKAKMSAALKGKPWSAARRRAHEASRKNG